MQIDFINTIHGYLSNKKLGLSEKILVSNGENIQILTIVIIFGKMPKDREGMKDCSSCIESMLALCNDPFLLLAL